MLDFETENQVADPVVPAEPILLVDPDDFRRLRQPRRFPWKILAGAVALSVTGAFAYWFSNLEPALPPYRFARVERGDLRVVVTATGVLQPITSVPVGAQVTGRIQTLHADFNSRVKAGQVLAEIDPAPLRIRLDQDRANEDRARSDVERVKPGLIQAEKELRRARQLAQKELIAPADADVAVATYDSLVAQLKTAHAVVAGAQAAVEGSEVNLKYCTILSPIDGIVLSRNVDVGQTVSAGLQAPTLFLISGSLARIQIMASVSESDIGKIRQGQKVSFSVEAYRDEVFFGRVASVRMSSVTVQNVVTYAVVIECKNPEEKLLPGMTATVLFLLSDYKDVLRIPNAAFRYKPDPKELADGSSSESVARASGRGARSSDREQRRIWCMIGGKLTPKDIECGETDGTRTRVIGDLIRDGDEVIIGMLQPGAPAATINPFGPLPRQRLR